MKNKKNIVYFLLIFILFLGAFLRLYKIREYITFLGDEGRDVLVVKRMIVDKKFTLLGPITSVGSIYMGPIYYYFMVPFLWTWQLDPVGPAVMVAIFATTTIALVFFLGRDYLSPAVGLIAAFFYATSPLTIIYGRSSWNPNVVPFFSILLIYSMLKIIINKKYNWLIVTGLSLGVLFQLHYVTLLFVPVLITYLFIVRFKIPLGNYLKGLASFLVSYSPFLLFELRHDFVNTRSVWRFVWQQKNTVGIDIVSITNTINDVLIRIFWRLIVIENAEYSKLFIILLGFVLGIYFYKNKAKLSSILPLFMIHLWIFIGIISFGLYRGTIYDYYFGSMFPAPFILTGVFFVILWRYKRTGKLLAISIFILLSFFHIKNSPLRLTPNNQVKHTETIARFVYEKTLDKPYNFALIAGKNSDHAYRYFLDIWNHPPVTIENDVLDPERRSVTDQLLVVCEEKVCQPLGHPLWEIAGFGRAEIVGEWQVATAKVFHLVHYKSL